MKKLFSILMAAVLMLGTTVQAYAAEAVVEKEVYAKPMVNALDEKSAKVSKDEAKEIGLKVLKDFFNMEIDEKKYQTSFELRQDYDILQKYLWEIRWDMNDDTKSMHINVSVDADKGTVLSVYKYEYIDGREKSRIASITSEQAKDIAEDFVKKINGDKFSQVKLMEDQSKRYPYGYAPVNYNFRYIRDVNGIKYDRDYISVEVDGTNGSIISYSYRWDEDADFPSVEGVISKEKASEILINKCNMDLRYIPVTNPYDYQRQDKTIKLVYAPNFEGGSMLDANTGEMVDLSQADSMTSKVKDITPDQIEKLLKNAKPVEKLDKEIDNNRAAQVIKEKMKELVDSDYQIETIQYMDRADYWETSGQKAWSAQFVKKDGNRMYDYGGRIVINALTEELISMYKYYREDMEEEKFQPKITWEQAYDKAIGLIAKYFPDKLKQIKTEQVYRSNNMIVNGKVIKDRRYYFSFPRMVNGIQHISNNISVNFDAKTGEVTELRCTWDDDLKFPPAEGTISREDAVKSYFSAREPELVYSLINKSQDPEKPVPEMKVTYRLKSKNAAYPTGNVDAFTGKLLSYDGQEIADGENGFNEAIKGHPAEKELGILAFQGIIDTKDFDVDREITVMELIKMVVRAKGYYPYMGKEGEELKFTNVSEDDENYPYLKAAVRYGIIENRPEQFNGEEKVTREGMAYLLTKLLGYEQLAKSQEIFKLPFEDAGDVSSDKVGCVAVCRGLGIFTGETKFRPKDNATMSEAALAIYKALANIKTVR